MQLFRDRDGFVWLGAGWENFYAFYIMGLATYSCFSTQEPHTFSSSFLTKLPLKLRTHYVTLPPCKLLRIQTQFRYWMAHQVSIVHYDSDFIMSVMLVVIAAVPNQSNGLQLNLLMLKMKIIQVL
ncbi:hypothetical protein LINPERPRIM_LOCUS15731 [Linum perenne]